MKSLQLELTKGTLRWHWRLKSKNGEIVASSQRYYSKSNARRAAKRLALAMGVDLKES